jgi:hypothetical protein
MKEIQLTKGTFTYVDDEDYLELSKYRWHLNGKYAHNLNLGGMHRFLMGFKPIVGKGSGPKKNQIQVDHIDGNTLNNQKSNLRLVNSSENQLNHISTKGKSKYRGVIWAGKQSNLMNAGKPWIARLKPTGKPRIYLGSFATEEEAALAYNNAVLIHSVQHGKLNHIGI